MKRMLILLILSVIPTALVLSQTASKSPSGNEEKEILKLRSEWYDAYFRGDTAVMERIETSDIVVISDRGIGAKREYATVQKAVKENRWMAPGTSKVDVELTIRMQGDVAIVHSLSWTKIPGQVEKPPENKTASTEVWVKRDGRWRVMHLQYHTLQPAPSGQAQSK